MFRLPKDWQLLKLENFAVIKHGYAFEGEFFSSQPAEYVLLTPGNFHRDGYLYFGSNTKYYLGPVPDGYVLENGDLLIVMTDLTKEMTILGNAVIMKSSKDVLHNQRIGKVKISNEKIMYADFLRLVFNSEPVKKHVRDTATGTTVKHSSPSKLLEPEVLVPPLPEQKKIAAILSSVDDVIEKTQAQIDKLNDLKTGMMQELLTKGIGPDGKPHTEFKDSLVGRIPVGWKVLKTEELAEVIDPQPDHRTPDEVEGGIPYIGLGDVKEGDINFMGARKVSEIAYRKQLSSFNIFDHAFMFGKIGTIGNPTILPTPRFYCLSANIILITSSSELYSKYLFQVYRSQIIDRQIEDQTNTTSQPALGIKKVREFLVPLPDSKEELEHIVSVFESLEMKLNAKKKKLGRVQNIKKALMQDLLTGKVRVNTNEIEEISAS